VHAVEPPPVVDPDAELAALPMSLRVPGGRLELSMTVIHGAWTPEPAPPVPALHWHVKAARTEAQARWPGQEGGELRGIGYVDWVHLTHPTRLLGFRHLRWGRAHVGSRTVVFNVLGAGRADERDALVLSGHAAGGARRGRAGGRGAPRARALWLRTPLTVSWGPPPAGGLPSGGTMEVEAKGELVSRVTEVVVAVLGCDAAAVTTGSSLADDLGADSLDVVQIVEALEQTFGLEVPDDALERCRRVADLIALVGAGPR
jgi:acyl carrier protein